MLQLENITKEYRIGEMKVDALRGISVGFRRSEFVAVLGPSGCGKTTLLNIIGGLDCYTSGDLVIDGRSTKDYRDADWDAYRNHSIGFVFQSYNLIGHQSVLSNVEVALNISGVPRSERKARAVTALTKVGLADQMHKKPNTLSGGQMQRVAIARALVNDPDIILADEPTGALDSETSVQIMGLLKEVAEDRLVVMVTHNPELAEQYATRTIRLKDGIILADDNPFGAGESDVGEVGSASKKVKLGFLSAMGLSFNNLLTKKGRTFLTAFAGAIGIIGIGLILALSSGMNDYISQIESDTMGSYPIELEKETFDIGNMMSNGQPGGGMFAVASDGSDASPFEGILSDNIVADTVASSESMLARNDLGRFKAYLDENYEEIENSVSSIEYAYDVTPQVFRIEEGDTADEGADSTDGTDEGADSTDGADGQSKRVIQVSPASLEESYAEPMGMDGFSMGGSSSAAWTQMVENEGLREKQYRLVEGEWPTAYNEIALVIDGSHKVSDFTLYTLGLMDIEQMDALVDAVKSDEQYDDPEESFTYDDAIGLEFKVFSQSDLFRESDEADGVWIDKSQDTGYIEEIFDSGTTVTITAILQSTDDADVSSGVLYTHGLTLYLMDRGAKSAVVKQQLDNPDVNILTGEAFEEDSDGSLEEASDGSDSESSAEANAAQVSYSTGSSTSGTTMGTASTEGVPYRSAEDTAFTTSAVFRTSASTMVLAEGQEEGTGKGSPKEGPGEEGRPDDPGGGEDEVPAGTYQVRFLNYEGSVLSTDSPEYHLGDKVNNAPKENPTRSADAVSSYVFIGWKSSSTNSVYLSADDIPAVTESVDYHAFYYSTPITVPENPLGGGTGPTGMPSDGTVIPSGGTGMPSGGYDMSGIDASAYGMAGMDASAYGNIDMGSYDTSAFTGGAMPNLSDEQLSILLAQMSDDTPSTYSEVLEALGYTELSEPSKISLYPTEFEGKTKVEEFIATYNAQVENDKDKVTYTDLVGLMTSSVSSIITIITYALVGFVAISLVVSSIMIAIITYISVLERTKEIGVLRALGASKGDVTKIFNAETTIEGLASGLLGVGIALLICIPINSIIYSLAGVDGIASLPIAYCFALVGISVALTFVAGFVPARMAAKKDPVVALRSE